MEFIVVRMLKAVCIFVTKVSIAADRMGNGKAMQELSLPIFMCQKTHKTVLRRLQLLRDVSWEQTLLKLYLFWSSCWGSKWPINAEDEQVMPVRSKLAWREKRKGNKNLRLLLCKPIYRELISCFFMVSLPCLYSTTASLPSLCDFL